MEPFLLLKIVCPQLDVEEIGSVRSDGAGVTTQGTLPHMRGTARRWTACGYQHARDWGPCGCRRRAAKMCSGGAGAEHSITADNPIGDFRCSHEWPEGVRRGPFVTAPASGDRPFQATVRGAHKGVPKLASGGQG
jgi:hypothetical protein